MKTQLDEQIARPFYACNIPFNVISHLEKWDEPRLSKAAKLVTWYWFLRGKHEIDWWDFNEIMKKYM